MDSALELPNYSSSDVEPNSRERQKYRKYSDVVRDEVAKTKNIYLFPDLGIPRTTAQYWVKRQRASRSANLIEIESVFKKKSEFLESELAKERAMRRLLETVRKVFPYDFRLRPLKKQTVTRANYHCHSRMPEVSQARPLFGCYRACEKLLPPLAFGNFPLQQIQQPLRSTAAHPADRRRS